MLKMKKRKARVIAFYLPQYHPIPENDKWWGDGFTEWTNLRKAKPLFDGHYQPRVPTELGYYDLRNAEVREAQAKMAMDAGVEGFMYWHYWFGNGKRLLEKPFTEVLKTGKPEFPFCLGWANHSWYAKNWNSSDVNGKDKLLIEQTYPGDKDVREHFFELLNAFHDSRYIKIKNKPIFMIYAPEKVKDLTQFIHTWQNLAKENGLDGIYFIGQAKNSDCSKILNLGFDGICRAGIGDAHDKIRGKYINKIIWRLQRITKFSPLDKYNYSDIVKNLLEPTLDSVENIFPCVVPNFDHSPRSGRHGLIYVNSTPALFRKMLKKTIAIVSNKKEDNRVIFLRSWNEWGEGNYVEPDQLYGRGYLEVMKEEIFDK